MWSADSKDWNDNHSDHILENGVIPESALDHVYHSESLNPKVNRYNLESSATDHVPFITEYCLKKEVLNFLTCSI